MMDKHEADTCGLEAMRGVIAAAPFGILAWALIVLALLAISGHL